MARRTPSSTKRVVATKARALARAFIAACSERVGQVPARSNSNDLASWLAVGAGQWARRAVGLTRGACHVEPRTTRTRRLDPATAEVTFAARKADHVCARVAQQHLTSGTHHHSVFIDLDELRRGRQRRRRGDGQRRWVTAPSSMTGLVNTRLLTARLHVEGEERLKWPAVSTEVDTVALDLAKPTSSI